MPPPHCAHEKLSFADGSYGLSSFFSPGSCPCTLKMMLELGNRMPRINCARFAAGGNEGVSCDATSAAGVDADEVAPRARMNATMSLACAAVNDPGSSCGIVFLIFCCSSDALPHSLANASPVSGGPTSPCSVSPWQAAQRCLKIS